VNAPRKPGSSVAALQAWGFGLLLLAAVLILAWSRLG
jgi:hypothetical protein